MATDLGKDLFDFASTLVRAQAAMVQRSIARPGRHRGETERPKVFLLFHGEIVLGVCGNRERADREAEALGHAFSAVIRIEPREVHS